MRNMLYAGAAIAALMIPAAASAQNITTGIEGTVTDASGATLSGAEIVITDTRTGASRTLTTNASGTFSATGLVTGGPYTVSANAAGFEGQTVSGISTTLQGATSLSFTLSSGEGEIVVTGSRVRATQLAVGPGTSFNAEVLASAPTFNRDLRDVIRIDPRVSLDREDAATGGSGVDRISCLGSNDRGNAFTVDGTPQSDVYGLNDTGFSSRSSTPVPYDAIRETQVQFAPFDVEYGQFSGCAINAVTKSGTNSFHGTAFFEYSDSKLRGKQVADRTVGPILADKRWGGSLGGPIFKDKLFFFGAYEHQEGGFSQDEGPTGAGFANPMNGISLEQFNQISEIAERVYGISSGGIGRSRPYSNDRYFVRADWQISDDHRLEGTYQRLEERQVRTDDFFTGSTPTLTGYNTFYYSGTESNYYSGRLYSQWSDQFSTEVRYAQSEITDLQDPIGGGEADSARPIPRLIIGIDNATGNDGTILIGPGANRSVNQLSTTLRQGRFLANFNGGNHRLKFGFEANHADIYNLYINNATGTLVFRNAADFEAGLLSPGTGSNQTSTTPSNVIGGFTEGAFGSFTPTGDPRFAAARVSRVILSAYAQDDWRISPAFSMVLGARIDWFDGSRPAYNANFNARYGINNNMGFSNLDPVLSPRIAVTWNASDFAFLSSTTVRAGAGIFSGGDPLVWFGNAFQNNGLAQATANSQAAGCPTGQIDVVTGGTFTGVPTCVRTAASNIATTGQGFVQAVDPDLKLMTVLRANVGIETNLNFADAGFFSNWGLKLDYIYSKYRDPYTMVDLTQVVDTRLGLNGRTIDGRPIYRTIDPVLCGARLVDINPTPVYSGVTAACFTTAREDELLLTNAGDYDSHVVSAVLSKTFEGGVFTEGGSTRFTLGYTFQDSKDRRNLYNSTAGSNYDQTAAFDRQNPASSRGFYSSKNNITASLNFDEKFVSDLSTRLGLTFVARSGRPYSLTFGGSGIFNDSASGSNNALLYIPTGTTDPNISPLSNMSAVTDLVSWAKTLDCAKEYLGRTIDRNTCSNDWYYDLDISFSQDLPGPGRLFGVQDKIRVFAMVDNFLNLLDKNANIQRRRNFAGLQDVAALTSAGIDAQGRYIFNSYNGVADFNNDNFINVSSSVYRIKVGVSYEF